MFSTECGSGSTSGGPDAEGGPAAGEALQVSAGRNPVSGASAGTDEVKGHILEGEKKFPQFKRFLSGLSPPSGHGHTPGLCLLEVKQAS